MQESPRAHPVFHNNLVHSPSKCRPDKRWEEWLSETHSTEVDETAGGLTIVDVPTCSEQQSQSVIISNGHKCQISDMPRMTSSQHIGNSLNDENYW